MSDHLPPEGQSEILESGGGRAAPATGGRGGRRTAAIAGALVGGVAVLGGAAWAANWYLSSGPSAAEVLPATTLGYVEINLDPSGSQKIAALETLKKFPAFEDNLDLGTKDDIRAKVWELVQKDGTCPDLDYADDISPWLGDRIAVAAVDDGSDTPVPVVAVEVADAGKAADGLDALLGCDGGTDAGYVIKDGWALIAETEKDAQSAVDAAAKSSLESDADFQRITGAAGGDGIMSMYAAPAVDAKLADSMSGLFDSADLGAVPGGADASVASDEMRSQLEGFKGAAMKVRFADGSVEAEFAGGFPESKLGSSVRKALAEGAGDDVVGTLPDDTALAFGSAVAPGWFDAVLEQVGTTLGDLGSVADMLAESAPQTGLQLPEDAETLTGDSLALAVSGGVDVEALVNSQDPTQLAAGLKVKGDAAAIESVLDKLRTAMGGDPSQLASASDGDFVGIGLNQDYADALVADGGLGGTATFKGVLPDAGKSSSLLFLDVDAGNDWLVTALEDLGAPQDTIDNVKPFRALGIAGWSDDDLWHGKLRLTTD